MILLRPYQQRVIDKVGEQNAIIKMPTGSGKTLVGAECMLRCLQNRKSLDQGALFLVPTCHLVKQQALAVQNWCSDLFVAQYQGGLAVPTAFDILVSTPEAFRLLQMRNVSFAWSRFAICVFDEVHHVLKDHPYRRLAHGLRLSPDRPQVVGMSASLTYAVTETAVQKSLANLIRDLGVQEVISVGDDELLRGGFTPSHNTEIEITHPRCPPEGIVPLEDRRPHLMHDTFFARVKKGELTNMAQELFSIVLVLEKIVTSFVASFCSPLESKSLVKWETYANKLKLKSNAQSRVVLGYLETFYVSLRLMVVTWEEEQELVLHWLLSQDAFAVRPYMLQHNNSAVASLDKLKGMARNDSNFSKVACLKQQLFDKKVIFGSEFRAIVFVEQRLAAHVLANYILTDPDLATAGFMAEYVTAPSSHITPSINVTRSKAKEVIEKFRTGEMNVLVATSVIEEGFDVPAANVIISYDPLKNSVELAQRFGRARAEDRRVVLMDQRKDRPIAKLQQARRQQDDIIHAFRSPTSGADAAKVTASQRIAQYNRERGARNVLQINNHDNASSAVSLQACKLYGKKTKAHLTETMTKQPEAGGGWLHTWEYESVLRRLKAEGRGPTKKTARQLSAANLLNLLRDATLDK